MTSPLARTLLARFEGLVSPKVLAPAERRVQAKAIGGLVAIGLAAAMMVPFAGLSGMGPQLVVMPTIAAGGALALAGLLASSGKLDLVLGLGSTVLAALVALFALVGGGLASPLLFLLLLGPAEAALAGRRTLAATACGLGLCAFGAIAMAEWFGGVSGVAAALGAPLTLAAGLLYGGLQTLRLVRSRAAARREAAIGRAEAGLIEEALSDAVLRFSADGRLLSASAAARAMFPSGGELDEGRLFHLVHVTDRVRYLQAFGDIRSGESRSMAEIRMRRIGGDGFRALLLTLMAVRDGAGVLRSVVGIARDVTEERAATEGLTARLAEALKGSDAKSEFMAAISHELRTPLNAIIGFSDVLDQEFFGGFETPRQKEYVGLIRQSGEHLLAVVNRLLDVSKIEAGRYELELEAFAIGPVLEAALCMIRPEAEGKGLRLHLRSACDRAEIVADPRAMQQILLNLLSNAVKFTDRGVVTLNAEIRAGKLMLGVSDTGIGIAREDIVRLGQPFVQLSSGLARRYQGTGLGLSLVKGLGELHHGRMQIESELGKGTTVTVEIPLDCAARIADQQTSKENVVALNHARKIQANSAEDAEPARRSA